MTNSNVLTQYQSEVIEALKSAANLGKPFEKVIIDTLKLFMAIPDKINFLQMGRYGEFTGQTYRNTYTRNRSLWCGFYLQASEGPSIYYVGDSAKSRCFADIRARLGV